MDITELSKRLGIPRNTLYDWAAFGKIPHLKIGKLLRFESEAIDKWLAGHRIPFRED